MGFLAEHTALHELLTERSGGSALPLELHADQQALATNLYDMGRWDLSELVHEVVAQLPGSLGKLLLGDDSQGFTRHRGPQGISAEGGTMVSGLEQTSKNSSGPMVVDGLNAKETPSVNCQPVRSTTSVLRLKSSMYPP